MYVIYHSSDSFARVTGTSMLSLFQNNKDMEFIHVLYIENAISEDNKNKLREIAEEYGREIEFMEMPNWSKKLNIELKSSKSTWLGFGYNRLFLTEFIPDNIDRVLYLDSDTIVEGSLDKLWNLDFEDYYLAGVDDCLSSKYRKLVQIGDNGTYCNSGMLLFNLKKWRKDNMLERTIKFIQDNNGYFVFNEQTILNSLCCGKIKILPQKYNVNSLVYLFSYKELIKLRQPYKFSYSSREFYDARKNPIITHFTGNFMVHRRPWITNSDHPHCMKYLEYYMHTPWKNEFLQQDTRSKKTRLYTSICKKLPRRIMIFTVSILYNYLRVFSFNRKIKKIRSSK